MIMKDDRIMHGYVCPVCKTVFSTEEDATSCLDSHETYSFDPTYALGGAWPVNVRMWRLVGGVPKEWCDYARDGDPKVVKEPPKNQ